MLDSSSWVSVNTKISNLLNVHAASLYTIMYFWSPGFTVRCEVVLLHPPGCEYNSSGV